MADTSIELFIHDDDNQQTQSIALVLRDPSIVEYEEELTPGCVLSVWQARELARSLIEYADLIYGAA